MDRLQRRFLLCLTGLAAWHGDVVARVSAFDELRQTLVIPIR